MEFGIPEAMWHLQTEGFAAIVTMDSHGNSLHAEVEKDSLLSLLNLRSLYLNKAFILLLTLAPGAARVLITARGSLRASTNIDRK